MRRARSACRGALQHCCVCRMHSLWAWTGDVVLQSSPPCGKRSPEAGLCSPDCLVCTLLWRSTAKAKCVLAQLLQRHARQHAGGLQGLVCLSAVGVHTWSGGTYAKA